MCSFPGISDDQGSTENEIEVKCLRDRRRDILIARVDFIALGGKCMM